MNQYPEQLQVEELLLELIEASSGAIVRDAQYIRPTARKIIELVRNAPEDVAGETSRDRLTSLVTQ